MDILSARINSLPISATLEMAAKARELKTKGIDIIGLSLGEPDFNTPEFIKDAAVQAVQDNWNSYSPVDGYADLKTAICNKFKRDNNLDYNPTQIVVSTGAKQSIANICMVLLNPGDEVLLPAPYWVSYSAIATLAEAKSKIIPSSIETDFKITPEQLEAAITPKTKLVMFNSPNNPSGTIYSEKEYRSLGKVLEKFPDIFILSDEIYADLSFDNRYHSISTFYPELTFISGGLSKWCGAGGWRLGFLAVPKKLNKFLSSLKSLASESYSTVNTPTQFAAVEAYEGDYSDYKLKVRGILNAVGNYVYNNLKSNKVLINPPQGAFYLMPEFKNSKYKSSAKLCEAILKDTGVAMLPGSDFGFKPKKMLTRLSYTDFDGKEFFRNVTNYNSISEEMVKRYAPNVVEGVSKLSNWAKNL